jgi:hypothetical protein
MSSRRSTPLSAGKRALLAGVAVAILCAANAQAQAQERAGATLKAADATNADG